MLTRDALKEGWLQRMAATPGGETVHFLTEAELEASRRTLLRAHPPADDLWLFGYGSLIWNPAFHFVERRHGRIHGFHRRFCLWTRMGRGCPERPGLMLGLDHGATELEIHQAYHRRRQQFAPERYRSESGDPVSEDFKLKAEELLLRLETAFDTLSRPDRKAAYLKRLASKR